jgi:hypothetical protein
MGFLHSKGTRIPVNDQFAKYEKYKHNSKRILILLYFPTWGHYET